MPTPSELKFLGDFAPSWVTQLPIGGSCLWSVAPERVSGAGLPATLVEVEVIDGCLEVREAALNRRLPEACPELHINVDGSFCLGRWAFQADDEVAVAAFWQALGEFLINVDFAMRRKFWPRGRWLSHGPIAADEQVLAEEQARALGLAADYADWLEQGSGALAPLMRDSRSEAVATADCPLGCRDDRGAARSAGQCRHRRRLASLHRHEAARKLAEEQFFSALSSAGGRCCGIMPRCGLQLKDAA